jgi:hypothetical protein
MLDHITAQQVFAYDPQTGEIKWLKSRGRVKAGAVAGNVCPMYGYRIIGYEGHNYRAHRIAWLLVHGVWPNIIDHINGDRLDNRLSNLRDGTHAENNMNQAKPKRANPYLGVSAFRGKWRAVIQVSGKQKHLGVFNTPEDAAQAYIEAKRTYHSTSRL